MPDFKLSAERMFRTRAIEVLRAHPALIFDLVQDDTFDGVWHIYLTGSEADAKVVQAHVHQLNGGASCTIEPATDNPSITY